MRASVKKTVVCFVCGAILTLHALYMFVDLLWRGFPDGHRTELDLIEIPVYRGLIIVGLLMAVYFYYRGVRYVGFGDTRPLRWSLLMPGVFFLVFMLLHLVLPLYFESGQGG